MSLKNPCLGCALFAVIASAPVSSAATFLIDFGMAGNMNPLTQGAPTASPDGNGNFWNNVTSSAYATTISGGTGTSLANLTTTANTTSTVGLALSGVWRSSGIENGGLNSNTPALGALGIQTATQDYFFVDGGPGTSATIVLNGLNQNQLYSLDLFGTRRETGVRTTNYSVTDANGVRSSNLQTTGAGIGDGGYNGNNNTVVNFGGLVPNSNGELVLNVSVVNGGFAYLGAMQLTAIPEPSISMLAGIAAIGLLGFRRRTAR